MKVYNIKHLILNFGFTAVEVKELAKKHEASIVAEYNGPKTIKNFYIQSNPSVDEQIKKWNTWNILLGNKMVKHTYVKTD